ncbi:DNA helicase-2 / ATP-dependent DNA helicase PcrA [Fontibacillus panacisegetis]|uniref:DNA 3'-5' helicase n=1 Tax=Fontibacillus panacisegetis TaxID=670482 RepID=A0A1G7H9Y7_9BACL|nr:ATP-dependent helicase [Fontibacillus panacisegetis]SDE97250.1 DNA helicase-2 / ATP-dependent DNA helicase PcrA [Fontibacillus panacisegetis]
MSIDLKLEPFFARKKKEIGVELNEVQQRAVLQTEGAMLLLATPGSGKTTTIIMKIGYLIQEKGVDPARIKAVTFSRASANDMKTRFSKFFPELPSVHFSTIHSLAYELVRDHFRKIRTNYQIIEGSAEHEVVISGSGQIDEMRNGLPLHKKIILREMYHSLHGDNITDDQMDELTTYISYIKNKMIPREKWSEVKVSVPLAERILEEYERFKQQDREKLLIDFDDMLTIGCKVMESDLELLHKYQRKYDYVLTDESQDTSMVQHVIIEKLASAHGNLCVVADDDQSIYSWRGAEPSYLLQFSDTHPGAVTLFMEQNYRSSQNIVDTANQFIRRNKHRYEKNMFTCNAESDPIQIRTMAKYSDQTKYLVQDIQKVTDLSEVAVLYRNNASSISLMNEFDRAGIPFYMKDVDNRFFSHWVVEDILNFMRMTYTDKRPDILEKIHLKFNGYISKQQMAVLKELHNNESVFDNLLNGVPLHDYQIKPITASKETFQEMRGMPPLHAIRVIRDRLGYEKALDKMCERLGFRREYLIGILNTLEEIADSLETMEDFAHRLKYLESALKTSKSKRGQNAVTFSTFHSAKGLEFERVYMIDLIEGIIPSSEDIKQHGIGREEAMEEAVRLFYVGMTRAKRHLDLITYRERDDEQVTPSSFVTNVRTIMEPSNKESLAGASAGLELKAGDVIYHTLFGQGNIVNINGDLLEISFSSGIKTLSLTTCLEKGLITN